MTGKVSDFGMSRLVDTDNGSMQSKTDFGPIKWMAPESLLSKTYSEKSDVWSWACLVVEVIFAQFFLIFLIYISELEIILRNWSFRSIF